MIIKQLSIFVENTPGRLAAITKAIGEVGVDIRALSIADTSDFGILRLIVNRPQEAVAALQQQGLTVSLTDVLAVGIDDKPGALSDVVALMTENEINIEYMYAFISRSANQAFVIMRTQVPEQALQVLQEQGIRLPRTEEVYHM